MITDKDILPWPRDIDALVSEISKILSNPEQYSSEELKKFVDKVQSQETGLYISGIAANSSNKLNVMQNSFMLNHYIRKDKLFVAWANADELIDCKAPKWFDHCDLDYFEDSTKHADIYYSISKKGKIKIKNIIEVKNK